jgi:pyridoxine 5-phosphate synthase
MPTKLSVNVNKVATLRNTRDGGVPSVVRCARIALDAGADGITVHPRPDRRHIRPGDVADIASLMRDYPRAELNIEGNPFHGLLEHVDAHRPAQCTLVPDAEAQSTSDHGWDLAKDGERLRPILARLRSIGVRTSLFMDADPTLVEGARNVGADRVELYTEPYAVAFARGDAERALPAFAASARALAAQGLGVNAGHDLSLSNLRPFLEAVPGVLEVSIGHALVADALEFGLAETVRRYLVLVRDPGLP